jgi:succinate-semialdehyde dehydrogenase / glutarate-semialdehyde dehydrogenase
LSLCHHRSDLSAPAALVAVEALERRVLLSATAESFEIAQILGFACADARVLREEIFGPVAPVASFDSTDEAIAAANDTEYGLVAYVYTRDLDRALAVCEGLETGMIGLNQGMVSNAGAPFGGVKQSGIGREGGKEGLEEFLETKYVAVNL